MRPASSLTLGSYLSPGLPEHLFGQIADTLADRLGVDVSVCFFTDTSGPLPGAWPDGVDLAFVCAPAYVGLRSTGEADLVPAAMVFADPRNGGRPRYHSDVVVAPDSAHQQLDDLGGARWAVNDPQSLSGYRCVLGRTGPGATLRWSGGHLRSIAMVRDGVVDAAAIDANVLAAHSVSDLRIVHTFGPHPVQPLVARSGSGLADAVAGILRSARIDHPLLTGFAPVSDHDYPEDLA